MRNCPTCAWQTLNPMPVTKLQWSCRVEKHLPLGKGIRSGASHQTSQAICMMVLGFWSDCQFCMHKLESVMCACCHVATTQDRWAMLTCHRCQRTEASICKGQRILHRPSPRTSWQPCFAACLAYALAVAHITRPLICMHRGYLFACIMELIHFYVDCGPTGLSSRSVRIVPFRKSFIFVSHPIERPLKTVIAQS